MAIVTLVVCTPALVACTSDPPQPCPTAARPGLAVAVGGRANTPAPAVPDRVGELIDQAVTDGTGINVIRVDGDPSIACALAFKSDAANPVARADDLNRYKRQARGILGATRAKEPEANPLQALVLASHAAGPGGPVVLIDSGLQTVAPLDFRAPGLLDADPDAVVKALSDSGYLPDLSGHTVRAGRDRLHGHPAAVPRRAAAGQPGTHLGEDRYGRRRHRGDRDHAEHSRRARRTCRR